MPAVKDEKAPAQSKEEKAEAKKERNAKRDQDRFVFVNKPEGKIAPQALSIVNILETAGKKGLTRKELVSAMSGVVETRQPMGRILTYYQKKLAEELKAISISITE